MKHLLVSAALCCSVVFSAPQRDPGGHDCGDGECFKGRGLPDTLPVGVPDDIGDDIIGEPLEIEDFKHGLMVHDEPEILSDNWITLAAAFEGDIILSDAEQLQHINQSAVLPQNNAIILPQKIWPRGVIPYVISNSYNTYERGQIAAAMATYHSRTCIKFVPRSTHRDYIQIYRGSGCSSMVGRQGGQQVVSLGTGCAWKGVVIHELMHAAGFWHEQSRWDRDSYVRINWGNIIRGTEYNFLKNNWNTIQHLGEPYDLGSIMHYGSKAFTRDYRYTTIDALRGGSIGHIGQRITFSQIDLNKLNKLYKCGGTTTGRGNKGCSDLSPFCSDWQKKGECTKNPAYMDDNCKKACNKCGNTCDDQSEFCSDWKSKGECSKNPKFMNVSCKKSCGKCGTTTANSCADDNQYCGDWARKGECTRNVEFMNKSCKRSCNACATVTTTTAATTATTATTTTPPTEGTTRSNSCQDINQHCSDWARKGECTRNADFMNLSCKQSCNSCHNTTTTATTEKATTATKQTTTTTPPTTTKAATTTQTSGTTKSTTCEDTHQHCEDWTSKGECTRNAGFMNVNCKKSCNACTPTTTRTTTDEATEVTTTAPTEEPTTTTKSTTSPGSICEDKSNYCNDWALLGYCETNAGYMLVSCRKSCDKC